MSDEENDNTPLPPMLAEDADATLYKYRDFASVPEDHDSEPSSSQANRSLESSIRVQKFPVKLYAILGQKEFSDIITWMPHGRSWKVLKPNLFESLVMPLFFEYSNYHSFNRLVNAWSFRRISSGPDRGSYYHELFLRGKPHLQKYMRRLPKTHKKLPMKKQDEPDFYKLDKTSPLPELEESSNSSVNSNMMALRRQGADGGLQGGLSAGLQGGLQGRLQSSLQGGLQSSLQGSLQSSLQGSLQSSLQGSLNGGFQGGLHGMSGGLSGGFSGMSQQMGQLGSQFQGTGGMGGQGGVAFGLNKQGKDSLNGSNGMNGMAGLGDFSSMGGSSGLGGPGAPSSGGLGDLGNGSGSGQDSQLFQLQRLRHLQHLQLFQRQIGAASLAGAEDLARIQAEHALGLRGRP